jgi:hypothetical protein
MLFIWSSLVFKKRVVGTSSTIRLGNVRMRSIDLAVEALEVVGLVDDADDEAEEPCYAAACVAPGETHGEKATPSLLV